MRRVDFITGIATAAVGVFASVDASDLVMFGENHVPDAGFLPKILAWLLIFLGLTLAAMSLRKSSGEEYPDGEVAEEAPSREGRIRAFAVLVAFGVIAPFVELIGFVPAMIMLVLVVLYGIERRRDFRSLLVVFLVPISAYLLFANVFEIPLPVGPLMAM